MADTNHSHAEHAEIPVQADGVSFRGVFWSVVVMFATTIVSQVLMVGAFKWLEADTRKADTARAPLSAPQGQLPAAPNLLYELSGSASQNEPGYLARYRAQERAKLHEYAYDQAAGTARIPIDRAKTLVLERGVFVGTGPAPGAPVAASAPAAPAPPAVAPADHGAAPKAH